jgi:hypothetical protein
LSRLKFKLFTSSLPGKLAVAGAAKRQSYSAGNSIYAFEKVNEHRQHHFESTSTCHLLHL